MTEKGRLQACEPWCGEQTDEGTKYCTSECFQASLSGPAAPIDESVNWLDKVRCAGCRRITTWHDLRDHKGCVSAPARTFTDKDK